MFAQAAAAATKKNGKYAGTSKNGTDAVAGPGNGFKFDAGFGEAGVDEIKEALKFVKLGPRTLATIRTRACRAPTGLQC